MNTTNKEPMMISQTLFDKLLELRLTAFREGLREQSCQSPLCRSLF